MGSLGSITAYMYHGRFTFLRTSYQPVRKFEFAEMLQIGKPPAAGASRRPHPRPQGQMGATVCPCNVSALP